MAYDVAIIGTGPAGLSAALNMKIHNKNFVWIGSKKLSDKISLAEEINNYPGFFAASGKTLSDAFKSQIDQMGIEITEAMVNSIMPFGKEYALMAGADFYQAKSVILTTGITMKNTFVGESEMVGRGVSYCATCDGGLYKGKTIAVYCNNVRFEHEVKYLAELAATVHYFPKYKELGSLPENVIIHKEKIEGVLGGMRVSGLSLKDGSELMVDGVFILRDSIALGSLLPGLETEEGHIKVNRQMETNMKGVFAAGDCTGRPYQYTKAVGEGNVAAHSVLDYLASIEE